MPIQEIRVKVNKKYHGIYRDLRESNSFHGKLFEMHGDIFTLCCTLGYKSRRSKPVEKGKDLFWSQDLSTDEEAAIKSIAITTMGDTYSILEDEKKVIQIAEEYAEGGMEFLIERVLCNYIKENDEGYYLHFSETDYLEKEIMSFIYSESVKRPSL